MFGIWIPVGSVFDAPLNPGSYDSISGSGLILGIRVLIRVFEKKNMLNRTKIIFKLQICISQLERYKFQLVTISIKLRSR